MSARSTFIAHAIAAWLLAAIVAFLVVYSFPSPAVGFLGMVVVGLYIYYLVIQRELVQEEAADPLGASSLGAQVREQGRAMGHQPSPSIQALRFLKLFGFGLMAIGIGGGLYYLLYWVLS